jgi:myo-inositol 2-dehydrogenase/D-chiro-inositol 1-dehydrogenase
MISKRSNCHGILKTALTNKCSARFSLENSRKKVGFGVVGVGAMGRVHAENLALHIPKTKLVAIADAIIEPARKLASTLNVNSVYSDFGGLIDDKNVEAILIAVPPYLKKEMTVRAAKAGKHVFVEKPMTLSSRDADEMIQATGKAGVKMQVGYQRRFDNSFRRAEAAISEGRIGKILMMSSHTRDPPGLSPNYYLDFSKSGGIMADTCSHDFDVIRWLSKSEVTKVYADGEILVYHKELDPSGIPDHAVVTLTLEGGTMAHVDACGYATYGYDVQAEVIGMKGAAFVGIGNRNATTILDEAGGRKEYPSSYIERFGQAYHDEVEDFARCILEDKTPKVSARDGKAAIEIGFAADESMRKKAPVNMSH